jgi:hypothetical protein
MFLGITSALLADSRTGRSWLDREAEEALHKGGVSLSDSAGLIQCLRSEDQYLVSLAAFALGNLPRTDDSVRALNELVFSKREMTMLYAIRSLHKLGETQWVAPTRQRFSRIVDPYVKIPIAGLLAETGHYDGWQVVLQESKRGRFVWDTVQAIPSFKGMRDSDGAPIDLMPVLKDLENAASEFYRPEVQRMIRKMSSAAPGKSPQQQK